MSEAFFKALERLRWTNQPNAEKRRAAMAKIEAKIRADERAAIVVMIKAQHETTVAEIVRFIEARL